MNQPVKILFINAQDTKGGAAIAAYRLGQSLETLYHTENYFIVGKKHAADPNIFCTRKNELQAIIEVLTDKVMNKLGLQYQYFPFSSRFILKKARELQPDIISLHNTHEGYFKTSLIKKLSRIAPIAWTLHDMWSFTANAVHTFGDESWLQLKSGPGESRIYPHIGLNTGAWLLRQKRRIYRKSRLHIITPSRWLSGLAGLSPVFAGKPITTIPHGLDLQFYAPKDKAACRNVLGIDPDAKVIVFSSADDMDISPWKGGSLLIDILTALNQHTTFPIQLLAIGKGELKAVAALKNLQLYRTGYVSSQVFMPILLSAADLFVYPTRADSFGLVLAETIACGTPAVTFAIGGCSDIIQDHISGVLVKPFDVDTFAKHTLRLLGNTRELNQLSCSARLFAEQTFGIETMAKTHYELFNAIIAKHKTP